MRTYVTGDTHGDTNEFKLRLRGFLKWELHASPEDMQAVRVPDGEDIWMIILGDFGGNFYGGAHKQDIEFKQLLQNSNINYFIIRGNHDQRPSKIMTAAWHTEKLFGGLAYVENQFPNIHYATDCPEVYEICGFKTLVLPGAYSVDKHWRVANEANYGCKLWFEDEQMTESERAMALQLCEANDNKFDVVLSHTCPWGYIPRYSPNITKKGIAPNGFDGIDQTMEYFFDDIDKKIEYKAWFYGHHHDNTQTQRGGRYQICLYRGIVGFEDAVKNGIFKTY